MKGLTMAYVVCEPCRDCKYTDCVVVCPCDCFYQDEQMLYINPSECIDCEACVPECPVEAIYQENNVPEKWIGCIQLNAERSASLGQGAKIVEKQVPKEGSGCSSRRLSRSLP
jgi:ferredoxin